jgi:hypothetical protein
VAIWPRLLLREACPSWASGEWKVCPLFEETLGRGVNLPWSTVSARGWARMRRDRVPCVDEALTGIAPIRPLQLCADGGYQLRLGVLGVPLIMVPDKNRQRQHYSSSRFNYQSQISNYLKLAAPRACPPPWQSHARRPLWHSRHTSIVVGCWFRRIENLHEISKCSGCIASVIF